MKPNDKQREIQSLQEELNYFREEKEKVRMLLGQIGSSNENKRDKILNITFICFLAALFFCDIVAYFWGIKILGFQISLELGVLLVSLKIIWMMHRQAKVEHFQFWILNSIEYRITEISKRVRELQNKFEKLEDSNPEPVKETVEN